MSTTEFPDLVGHTFTKVEAIKDDGDTLLFTRDDGRQFRFWHIQDCCENVDIEDVCGSLDDLVGTPVLQAEKTTKDKEDKLDPDGCEMWTFYRFATAKGTVVVRWFGESNGYYGVDVDFDEVRK